jgi:hypothetical protein
MKWMNAITNNDARATQCAGNPTDKIMSPSLITNRSAECHGASFSERANSHRCGAIDVAHQ